MRALAAVSLACAVTLAGAVSASGAVPPKKKTSTFPTTCSALFTLAVADSVTGHTFTSIVTHSISVNGKKELDCFFHDAATPPSTSKQAGAVFLNHIVAVQIAGRTKANAAFFTKMEHTFEAEAPGRAAKDPQCQPGYVPPATVQPPTPSMCTVLHPFGASSVEYDDFGIGVLMSKYYVSSLSSLHDTLQEPLVHLAMTKLH